MVSKRLLLCVNGERINLLHEYNEKNEKWKRLVFKPLLQITQNACFIKNGIMITGRDYFTRSIRIELMKEVDDNSYLSTTLCNTPLPDNCYSGYSITSIEVEKVILAGGLSWLGTAQSTVFEGILDKNDEEINWTELPSFTNSRCSHAALSLNNKLYIVGGNDSHDKVLGSIKRNWQSKI